jgi:predicted nuclease of restriction endonuclease-like (RecB) superfamily
MQKKLAKEILPLVNDTDKYPVLQAYVAERIEVMRGYLETTKEQSKILEIQGAIAELRRFQTLREQAIEGAKSNG